MRSDTTNKSHLTLMGNLMDGISSSCLAWSSSLTSLTSKLLGRQVLLFGEYPVGLHFLDSLEDVSERAVDARVKYPHFAIVFDCVLTIGVARVKVGVNSEVVQAVVDFALTSKKLLVVGLVHFGAHYADFFLRVVQQQPQGLQADGAARFFSILAQQHNFGP
ncbi:hypothetical protein BpHYR1_011005 [Brachionus plicatilis]|uniref:Uncharacterized protein n=1 Tax=Brachionus plicatilis TaxID=10195 RepID=A0A3M7PS46_BRAPC|nr:hypothetical protein BpHYR1_011005 [Brachionus plicatilis]